MPTRVMLLWIAGGLMLPLYAFAQAYEKPPQLRAQDVLPAELLKGPHHEVAEQVTSDGVALRFEIRSDYGSFDAPSRRIALLRIDEIAAIARLKELGSSEVFAKALGASVEKKAKAVAQVAQDPEGTAKGVGKGLKRLWGKTKKTAETVADSATEDDDGGEKASASDMGNAMLGVNRAKRQMAQAVGADPYSSNGPLQMELDRLAKAAVAGGITGGMGTRIPGIDQVASASNLVWETPPEDLLARNQEALRGMGCDEACLKAFLGNPSYTPSLQTALVVTLETLDGLPGRATLIEVATDAESEVEARFYIGSASLLEAAANKRALKQAGAFGRTFSVVTSDGTWIVAADADLVAWTEEVEVFALRPTADAQRKELWLSGELSSRARTAMQAGGWDVHENASP